MATTTEEQKKRVNSFGDVAAATSNPGGIQYAPNYGPAGHVPRAPSPAGVAPAAQMGANLSAVRQASAEEVGALKAQGNTAQAIGASIRGDLASVPAFAADVGGAIAKDAAPVMDGVRQFTGGLFGGSSPSPQPASQPTAAAAPLSTPALPSGDRQDLGQYGPADKPSAQAGAYGLSGQDQYRTSAGNISKTTGPDGRVTYSGTNIGPGATINSGEPGGGNVVVPGGVRGLAAATAQAPAQPGLGVAPVVRHSGNDWQIRNELRNAQTSASTLRGDWDRFRDGEIDNRGRATGKGGSVAQAAYQALAQADADARGQAAKMPGQILKSQTDLVQETMREAGATNRANAANAISAGKLSLDARRLQSDEAGSALDREKAGLGVQFLRDEAAQRRIMLDPNASAEQRKQAQTTLAGLQGKQEQANRFTVVPGGQQVDQASGRAFTVPSQVLNNQTGQFVDQPGQSTQAMPEGMRRQVGTSQGRPVYEDDKGNRFVG